jgi:DNA transformation protein and related proteins
MRLPAAIDRGNSALVDAEHIRELFREFGLVQVRRMFGGAGLYADGVMFALVSDDLIYLKTDDATAQAFETEHCAPFQYDTKDGPRALRSYWRLPDRLYDDPEELAQWARQALLVARQGTAARQGAGRKRQSVKRPASRRRRR